MLKALIIVTLICIALFISVIFCIKTLLKKNRIISNLEYTINHFHKTVKDVEKNIRNSNEKKEKFNTGNADSDIDNAVSEMSDISQRISQRNISNTAKS